MFAFSLNLMLEGRLDVVDILAGWVLYVEGRIDPSPPIQSNAKQ